ncbi:hypothetical protein PENTCL1PPCAC_28632, partial [Pristionchus entomophagus]
MVLPVGAPNPHSALLPRHSIHARTARYVQQQQPQPAVVVQHTDGSRQHHTEIRLDRSGGGFFASGLLRPTRQRAYSMLPLQTSQSSEELTGAGRERATLISQRSLTRRSPAVAWRHKYYPLSNEEALELLYLLDPVVRVDQLLWTAQGRAMSVFVPPDGVTDEGIRKERLSRKMTARRKFSMMVTINEAALRNGR